MLIKELSEIGTYHKKEGCDNLDALCYGANRRYAVISLADGASECREAKKGAEIASRAITDLFLKKGGFFLEFETEKASELALSHILYELRQQAAEESKALTEYSSTIASVLIDREKKRMLCMNLGRSLIMASGRGKCSVLAQPGADLPDRCASTTSCSGTQVSVRQMEVGDIESVVIFSDGAWRHIFDKNKLRPEAAGLLAGNEYDGLREYLLQREHADDCSFISLSMAGGNGRQTS